jgi:hypothetical protein
VRTHLSHCERLNSTAQILPAGAYHALHVHSNPHTTCTLTRIEFKLKDQESENENSNVCCMLMPESYPCPKSPHYIL